MATTTTSSLFDWKFSLKLAFLYILAKLKFVHGWLPETLREQLPIARNKIGWGDRKQLTLPWSTGRSGVATLPIG